MENVVFQRFRFHTMKQEKSENIFEFQSRLREQARFCGFSDVNSQIYDKIVRDSKFSEVREIAFKYQLRLDELLRQISRIEKSANECSRCGRANHFAQNCLAKFEKCMICREVGHFAKKCTNLGTKRSRESNENEVKEKRAKLHEKNEKCINGSIEKIDLSIVKKEKDDERPLKENFTDNNLKKPSNEQVSKDKNLSAPINVVNPLKKDEIHLPRYFPCHIGDSPAKVIISDEFAVCVMTKVFFDSHPIKCVIHNTKETIINGVKFSRVLSSRVQNNVNFMQAEFFFTDELKQEYCIISTHVAKQIKLIK